MSFPTFTWGPSLPKGLSGRGGHGEGLQERILTNPPVPPATAGQGRLSRVPGGPRPETGWILFSDKRSVGGWSLHCACPAGRGGWRPGALRGSHANNNDFSRAKMGFKHLVHQKGQREAAAQVGSRPVVQENAPVDGSVWLPRETLPQRKTQAPGAPGKCALWVEAGVVYLCAIYKERV